VDPQPAGTWHSSDGKDRAARHGGDGQYISNNLVSGAGGAGLRANDATVVDTLVVGAQFVGNATGCISEAVGGQVQAFGVICR
jgi:hypothetical protein